MKIVRNGTASRPGAQLMEAGGAVQCCAFRIEAAPIRFPSRLRPLFQLLARREGVFSWRCVRKDFACERPEFSHPAFDLESRVVVGRIGELSVASVYVPNGGKDYAGKIQFLRALIAFAESFRIAGAPLVICGDLNVARADIDVHPKERKANAIGQLPEERAIFDQLLSEGQRDIARDLHPEDADFFTWWAPWRNLRQRNIGWRIDYILASTALAEKARACQSLREVGTSDHAPLVATFD